MEPFLKWAGGKRWLVKKNIQIAPDNYSRYVEPFLGSGAVFFSLPQTPFLIADLNSELIDTYTAIKDNWLDIEKHLKRHQKYHSKEYYYQIRSSKPKLISTRAAKFIYLNRTCFNGLYRVNLKGDFNVPIGSKDTVILSTDDFQATSKWLQNGRIICNSFETTLAECGDGDFVFIDPPYTANHNLNGFLKYNQKIFSWNDQIALQNSVLKAAARGAKITMTNADHESIHGLYEEHCSIETVSRKSAIAGRTQNRGQTTELIMRFGWAKN